MSCVNYPNMPILSVGILAHNNMIQVIKINKNCKNGPSTAEGLQRLAHIYLHIGNISEALKHAKRTLKICEQEENFKIAMMIYKASKLMTSFKQSDSGKHYS